MPTLQKLTSYPLYLRASITAPALLMESKKVEGLYFIGEVVDVTGWLGGYNFQWAWSSGWCAGQVV
jgi:hypothetical protein